MQPVVLLADDNEDDVLALRHALRRAGIDVPLQVVEDGEEAIAYLRGVGRFSNRAEFPLPDLFLLDLRMPKLDGFEVLEWLRQQPSLAPLRTIVLTMSNDVFDVDRAFALGANSFLTKSMDLLDFGNTLEATFNYWLKTTRAPHVHRPGELDSKSS
ncbi:MAG TPA: response regulator [Verrucomicrobiae bacterium]|nr:response regulator [Verrucomicrobiae bacterium]